MHYVIFICVLLCKSSAGYEAKHKEIVSKVSKTRTFTSSPNNVPSFVKAPKSSSKSPEIYDSPSLKKGILKDLESASLSPTTSLTVTSSQSSSPSVDSSTKPTKISAKERENAFIILIRLIWNFFAWTVKTFIWTFIPLFDRLNLILVPPVGLICAFSGGFIEVLTIGDFWHHLLFGGAYMLGRGHKNPR